MRISRNRNLAQGFRLTLLLAAALSLPACVVGPPVYGPQNPYDPDHGRGEYGGSRDQIDGFVTFEGRCPTIREHESNQVFALAGNTRSLRPGDHVVLSTQEAGRSSCGGNAPTLEVVSIDTVWKGEDHRSAYFDASRDGDFDRFIVANRERGGWYADRYAYRSGSGPGSAPGDDRGGQYDRGRDRGRDQGDDRDHDRNGDPGDRGQYAPPPGDPNDREEQAAPPEQMAPPDQTAPPEQMAPPADRDNDQEDQEQLSVTGKLDFGGSCPAIRTPNGESYDLAGDLGNYHDGDRVTVVGVVGERSSCGGNTLEVQEIRGRR
jgi:hypothetical protein